MAQPIPFPRVARHGSGRPDRRPPLDVRPPELWPRATPLWVSLSRWVREFGRSTPDAAALPARDRLGRARSDFVQALCDVPGVPASDLQTRIRHARSLRELWHLRTELFSLVSRRYSQFEAERRLERLNAHFPVHAPRSAPLRQS